MTYFSYNKDKVSRFVGGCIPLSNDRSYHHLHVREKSFIKPEEFLKTLERLNCVICLSKLERITMPALNNVFIAFLLLLYQFGFIRNSPTDPDSKWTKNAIIYLHNIGINRELFSLFIFHAPLCNWISHCHLSIQNQDQQYWWRLNAANWFYALGCFVY